MDLNFCNPCVCTLFGALHVHCFSIMSPRMVGIFPLHQILSFPSAIVHHYNKLGEFLFLMAFSRSHLSSTKDRQNCLNTHSLVHPKSDFGQILPVFSSNKIFFYFFCFLGQEMDSRRFSPNHRSQKRAPETSRLTAVVLFPRVPIVIPTKGQPSFHDRHARHSSTNFCQENARRRCCFPVLKTCLIPLLPGPTSDANQSSATTTATHTTHLASMCLMARFCLGSLLKIQVTERKQTLTTRDGQFQAERRKLPIPEGKCSIKTQDNLWDLDNYLVGYSRN